MDWQKYYILLTLKQISLYFHTSSKQLTRTSLLASSWAASCTSPADREYHCKRLTDGEVKVWTLEQDTAAAIEEEIVHWTLIYLQLEP